jgi:hypothetical protein
MAAQFQAKIHDLFRIILTILIPIFLATLAGGIFMFPVLAKETLAKKRGWEISGKVFVFSNRNRQTTSMKTSPQETVTALTPLSD